MNRRLKVLHLITNACRHPYFCLIADYADRSRFDLTVASLAPSGALHEDLNQRGIRTFALNCTAGIHYPRALSQLTLWLRREKVDVVQTHLFEASLIGLAAAGLARTPLSILTGHHSQEIQLYHRRLPLWADRLASRWLSHYIIAPSLQTKETLIREEGVARERIAVVPHGLDIAPWQTFPAARQRVRKELGLDGKIVFGAVGRLYWIKDYPSLLKAFAPIAVNNPEAMLLIVGAGDPEPLLIIAKDLAIENRVVFTGQRADMADMLAAMDLFVHASLAESFGLVIIEALAAGKPIVSTDVGVARDAIEEGVNGFLVPAGNTEALRAALERMILSRERWEQMGRDSLRRAASFSAQKMVAGYEEHYLNWLANRGKLNGAFSRLHRPEE